MKLTILITAIIFSVNCFAQPKENMAQEALRQGTQLNSKAEKIDSLSIPVISFKEFQAYLERINLAAMKQFDLTQQAKYNEILKEIQAVFKEADKKRKAIK